MKLADIKVYLKFLSRNKVYTIVSVFGFSISLMFVILLGIYVKQQLSTDRFHENKDQIYLMLHDGHSAFGNTVGPYVRDKLPEVENYLRVNKQSVSIGKKGTEKIMAEALFADSIFFSTFTFPLKEGNPSNVLATNTSAVVSHSFANKAYAGKNPVGQPIFVNNEEYTITGIMEDIPQNTSIPEADIIINYRGIAKIWGSDHVLNTSDNFGFTTFLITKKNSDIQAKVPMMLELFKKEFWLYKEGFTQDLQLVALQDVYFTLAPHPMNTLRSNSRQLVMIYTAIVILILIIALLNYINLTVAQSGFRGKEAAIKKLLGCNRKGLVNQLLGESLMMSVLTFGIGLLLAFASEPFFNEVLSTKLNLSEQFNLPVLAFSIGFIVLIALLAGVIPATVISNFNPLEVVKGTFRRKVKTSYSKVLIIFQYTIAVSLLICSFFISKQTNYFINYDMGFNRGGIFEMQNVLEEKRLDGLKDKLLGIPGVELVSFSVGTPLNGGNNMSFEKEGQQYSFQEFKVDSAFFEIYGIKIQPNEVHPTTETYWLNQKAYNAMKPDSITKIAEFEHGSKKQVAGIFSDFNIRTLHTETGLLRISLRQKGGWWPWNVIVKIAAGNDLYKTADQIKKVYSDYAGGEIIAGQFVDDTIQEYYQKETKMLGIMSAFTLLTIVIMIMGVFAMSLYMIRQKQKEIALRKVNGATVGEVLAMLNKESAYRVLIAFLIGCPIAYYAVSKWLEDFPFRVSIDWWVFLLAGIIILVLTLLSVSWMTWKAARTNPIESLRSE